MLSYYLKYNRSTDYHLVFRSLFILLGALLVAISLELFLVENNIIDGGIVGIAILLTYLYPLNVGVVLFFLNIPFLLVGYYYLGSRFLLLSLFASSSLAIGTSILDPLPAITHDPVIVVLFGGFLLGLGVGIIIRFGGSLDGTEIIAILINKRFHYSIGQSVMIFNFFIFSSSVFVFGWKEAIFSLVTFFIAYQTIDFSIKFKNGV